MECVGVKGIVSFTIEYDDGRVIKETKENLIVAPAFISRGLNPEMVWYEVLGEFESHKQGLWDINFGSNGTAPNANQLLSDMNEIISKPITGTKDAGNMIIGVLADGTQIGALSAVRTQLLNADANGSTIRELGLIYTYGYAEQKFLFSRIVRAPIVKTSDMKITVEWWIAVTLDSKSLINTDFSTPFDISAIHPVTP